MKSITNKDGFILITIPPGAYEVESLNNEIKMIIFEEGHFTDVDYPFTIKPNFSTFGSIMEISSTEPLLTFLPNDCMRNLLGFSAVTF